MCKFVKMEDKFLGLEKEAVKEQKDMGDEMEKLHKYMESEFGDVDLSHITQCISNKVEILMKRLIWLRTCVVLKA